MQIFLVLAILLAPASAFAYLDPGSGAVLINLIIAGFAALIYSFKNLLLRILGKHNPQKHEEIIPDIAIFSEGKSYQHTFLPIVEALIFSKTHFSYYSLEPEDPLLEIDNDFCHNRFLGYGAMGRYRANNLSEPIVLSTTPNIGSPGYPVRRSPKIKNLVHVFHSVVDISMYRRGSLDSYDTVILPGDYHIHPIRVIEAVRGLKEKHLLSLGAPYLDVLLRDKELLIPETRPNCILVASSWGDKGLLKQYGIKPFVELTKGGFEVIIRPHPHSWKHEPELLRSLQKESSKSEGIVWDTALSPVGAMNRAALMISDTSSVRFDFAFIYEKPVLSLEIPVEEMPGFERDDLEEIWSDHAALEIGRVISRMELETQLERHVTDTLAEFDAQRIRKFRDQTVLNFGHAGKAIADFLINFPKAKA